MSSLARMRLYAANAERVSQLGWRARHKLKGGKFVVVCIDVDDPSWTALVEELMPNQHALWESYRDKGMKPIARGSVLWEPFVEQLSALVPDVADTFNVSLDDGMFFAVVLAEGGCTVLSAHELEEPS